MPFRNLFMGRPSYITLCITGQITHDGNWSLAAVDDDDANNDGCVIWKSWRKDIKRISSYRVVQKKRYPSFNFAITSVNVHRL